jgi:hypothetical protein
MQPPSRRAYWRSGRDGVSTLVAIAILCLLGCASPLASAVTSTSSGSDRPLASFASGGSSPHDAESPGRLLPCAVTSFETIPPNDVVGWQVNEWQRATAGIWGHPYLDRFDTESGGFPSGDPAIKVLWWIDDPSDLGMVLTIESIPPGTYDDEVTVEAPGPQRRDRPAGFSTPPPGCYRIGVTIGTKRGSIVDRVLP